MKKFAIITGVILIGVATLAGNLSFVFKRPTPTVDESKKQNIVKNMLLTSPAFKNDEFIPKKYTCDGSTSPAAGGGNVNPELDIQNVPEGTGSLALIMDDPDATGGRTFTHWLVWNIDPKTTTIKEESVPPNSAEGTTDFAKVGYGGPCPPKGSNPHRYFFKLYALDATLGLPAGAGKNELEAEISKHLITKTELIGFYKRQGQ